MLTMLAKEMQANTSVAAMPVIEALARECCACLDIMAAESETAFVAAVHALHAELGASVPAGAHAQQATAGSEPVDFERDADPGAPCSKKARTQAATAEAELPSFFAEQAVCSGSHATRFLFATLALAVSEHRAASSTGVGSTVRQQLRLALSLGVSPAIGEALGEVLFTVCSAASSDLSRACRRIFVQAATRQVGLGDFLSSALDQSQGGLTPIPFTPGLLFAARVDVAALAAKNGVQNHYIGGCGNATVGLVPRDEGEAMDHVPDEWWLSVRVDQLPTGCKLPAVGCVVREEDAAAFLAAPVAEWETVSERLRDGKGHDAASWQELSELGEFPEGSVMLSMAPGTRVLLLHAQRT